MNNSSISDLATETLPKLGFLGVGWIGKNRLESLVHSKLAKDISICDPHLPSMKDTLKSVPEAKTYGSYGDLLSSDVDGIVIATPSALHAKQALLALEQGKAVFCQKPLGRNLAETEAVVEMARQADKLLAVDFSYRYTEGIAAIKALIDQQAFGKIFAVEATFHNAYGPDKSWFYDPNLSGGGCLVDLGSHLIDLIFYLFASPSIGVSYANLLSRGKQLLDRHKNVEDYAEAQLKTSDGISIHMACSWKSSVGKDADISLKIYGTDAGASFHNVNGSFFDFEAKVFNQNSGKTLVSPPDDWGGKAIQDWARKLANNNRFSEKNKELIKSAAVLENIYKF